MKFRPPVPGGYTKGKYLTPKEQAVFDLRSRGMNYREIARELGIAASGVHQALGVARDKMRILILKIEPRSAAHLCAVRVAMPIKSNEPTIPHRRAPKARNQADPVHPGREAAEA